MSCGAQVSGRVSYNGHELHEFLPERTAVYVEQEDQHMPELTVRETLNFSARCQGVGSNAGAAPDLILLSWGIITGRSTKPAILHCFPVLCGALACGSAHIEPFRQDTAPFLAIVMLVSKFQPCL